MAGSGNMPSGARVWAILFRDNYLRNLRFVAWTPATETVRANTQSPHVLFGVPAGWTDLDRGFLDLQSTQVGWPFEAGIAAEDAFVVFSWFQESGPQDPADALMYLVGKRIRRAREETLRSRVVGDQLISVGGAQARVFWFSPQDGRGLVEIHGIHAAGTFVLMGIGPYHDAAKWEPVFRTVSATVTWR